MMFRRVGGLLIAVLVLQLNIQSVAAACSTNSSHAKSSAPRHTKTVPDHHHVAARSQEAEHSEAPCETPVRTECCQAMISCGGTLLSSATSTSILSQHDIAIVTPYTLRIPTSRIAAPEPPPPKA
ncbi:MAG: hypothetical protein DMD39_05375 [Gemmatimonadetes bacterium]|nr:MAG: hypothetical protein DMD39_05375 [Gemmatimonadota bacterium]